MSKGASDYTKDNWWDKGDGDYHSGYWNKTGDLTIPDDNNQYTITGWSEKDGKWSKK